MNKLVSDYLNALCAPIRAKEARLAARAEVSGHIASIVEELRGKGMGEEEAIGQALERMGDPSDIGRQIALQSRSWTNAVAAGGGVLVLISAFAFLGTFVPIAYLLETRALAFVAAVTLGLVLIGGVSRFTRRSALERARVCALYAGATGTIIGAINALGNLGDYEKLGVSVAFCITSLLYGVIVSAVTGSLSYLTRPLGPEEIRELLGNS